MGFVIVVALALYLLISIGVVAWTVNYAKKNKKSAKRWACGAALVMYLIPFWDWIPTVAVHQYYCSTEAGFWVYKAVEQWKIENPGAMESLTANKGEPHNSSGNDDNYTDIYFLNQRFNMVVKHQGPLFLHQWRYERTLVDAKTNDTLGRYVDFSTSQERRQAGWSGWKLWLDNRHCSGGRDNAINSGNWINQFKGIEK